jgi:hypothetical protein
MFWGLYSLNHKNTSHITKKMEGIGQVTVEILCPKRKCMAAGNSKARQPKNKRHNPMQKDQRHVLNIKNYNIYPKIERSGCHNWHLMERPKKEMHGCRE